MLIDGVNHKNDLKVVKPPQNENKADMQQDLLEGKENQKSISYK